MPRDTKHAGRLDDLEITDEHYVLDGVEYPKDGTVYLSASNGGVTIIDPDGHGRTGGPR